MSILEMNKFTFCYPNTETTALRDIDISVNAGEFILLCGSSGCGKTTLLRCMKEETAPAGKRSGRLVNSCTAETGYVFQNPENQIVTDTVRHELAFGLENLGLPTSVIRQRVAETALFFGIDEWIDRSVYQISGGEKQLLNLASVMAMRPKLLLLDEPTAQLDPSARKNFLELLVRVNRELGIAVIVSEHHLEEMLPYTDRVILMEAGQIRYTGQPVDFVNYTVETDNPYKKALPAAARIAAGLGETKENIPLDVRGGRTFLADYVKNRQPDLAAVLTGSRTDGGRETLLRAEHLWYQYSRHEKYVIQNLVLELKRGEMHMLLGGNGSGKSTLLYLLSKRYFPERGKIRLRTNGKEVRTGLLVQNPKAMFSRDTVQEELDACGCKEELIKRLGLSEFCTRHPYDLSGGEQQRLALAMVLAQEPDLLLLDEPTKGLDPLCRDTLGCCLREYAGQGHTVLCVTHDVEFAAAYGETCSLLLEGEVLSTEAVRTFFAANTFYTTDAARVMRGFIEGGLLCEDLECV